MQAHRESPPSALPCERPPAVRAVVLVTAGALLASCGGAGGAPAASAGRGVKLIAVEHGALVDVYGLRRTPSGGFTSALFQRDVLIGADIPDERDSRNADRRDNEILYDFISANTDNLQPRLLITREIGTPQFAVAFAALDDRVRRIAPARHGQDTTRAPFPVVPRNAALRVTFSGDLGLDASFFYTMAGETITAVRNPEAVQLLRIIGNPEDGDSRGDFEVIPARVVPRGNQLLIDPVLLGSEGFQLQVRNQAGGLPEAPDQVGANIRLAIALEGPLAAPGIKGDAEANALGGNNQELRSIIRDLRAGHRLDDSAEISRGFRRDPLPPRIVGDMLTYLERVEEIDAFTQLVTIYKGNVRHRIDAGDALRIVSSDATAALLAVTEVVSDPRDRADVRHTTLVVRRDEALSAADPAKLTGYPADRTEREAWLPGNAPRAIVTAEFQSGDGLGAAGTGDDPKYFVRFSPQPLPETGGSVIANRNVSPFAAALVRFNKPMDLATVRALDSLFFATKPLYGAAGDAAIADYLAVTNMDPAAFDRDKFATPHLVVAGRVDEDGSQTTMRLQPPLGFYVDDTLRLPQNEPLRTYYLHILGGRDGIKDLAGNELDFLADPGRLQDAMVIDFTLDARSDGRGQPLFPNNRVANVARRFAVADEDENPSYFRSDEIQTAGGQSNEKAYRQEDIFGAVQILDGRMLARPTARISRVADDLNQQPPPPQLSELRFCPATIGTQLQVANTTAGVRFGQPIQNPLNPYGCRLMTVWREIDLNLSRVDPADFNLDVEEVHWAPHTTRTIVFDEFDRMSLFLGHSERRPENCVGATSALPSFPQSGLVPAFDLNYAANLTLAGGRENDARHNPPPHVGYLDHYVVLDANMAFTEPNNVNRYMPLPPLQKPYFVWRDETAVVQGGVLNTGADVNTSARTFEPYIISPWLMGGGRYITRDGGGVLAFNLGRWINANNKGVRNKTSADTRTDGLVGSIALPLLGDFQMHPDEASLPEGRGYVASGANGWQIALAVQSSALPNYRVYSAGGVARGQTRVVAPGSNQWSNASGGINPETGQATPAGDNSFYWAQWDFLKRQSVATAGFIDVLDPHRVDPAFAGGPDPRLGPYFPAGRLSVLPRDIVPSYSVVFEPPLHQLPGGTDVIAQYRGASIVDPTPWIARDCAFPFWALRRQVEPDHLNFPLDPRKAGDAGIRKFSDQFNATNQVRNHWVYTYNLHVTDYVDDPNQLTQAQYLAQFAGPVDSFQPHEVRYLNWRFIMKNNVEGAPPTAPELESYALVYRFEQR